MIFCFIFSFSLTTEGSGIENMSRSVARLMAEEKYHTGRVSRHQPAVLGMMKLTGRHEMPSSVICAAAQTPT